MAAPDPGFQITLNGLLIVWQLVGAPLVGLVFIYVRDISKQLRKINNRVTKCETQAEAHERELDQIQRELRASRERQV